LKSNFKQLCLAQTYAYEYTGETYISIQNILGDGITEEQWKTLSTETLTEQQTGTLIATLYEIQKIWITVPYAVIEECIHKTRTSVERNITDISKLILAIMNTTKGKNQILNTKKEISEKNVSNLAKQYIQVIGDFEGILTSEKQIQELVEKELKESETEDPAEIETNIRVKNAVKMGEKLTEKIENGEIKLEDLPPELQELVQGTKEIKIYEAQVAEAEEEIVEIQERYETLTQEKEAKETTEINTITKILETQEVGNDEIIEWFDAEKLIGTPDAEKWFINNSDEHVVDYTDFGNINVQQKSDFFGCTNTDTTEKETDWEKTEEVQIEIDDMQQKEFIERTDTERIIKKEILKKYIEYIGTYFDIQNNNNENLADTMTLQMQIFSLNFLGA
jgi:hypothetical protein